MLKKLEEEAKRAEARVCTRGMVTVLSGLTYGCVFVFVSRLKSKKQLQKKHNALARPQKRVLAKPRRSARLRRSDSVLSTRLTKTSVKLLTSAALTLTCTSASRPCCRTSLCC